MATEFRLPKLAEGDATGTVVRVLVAPGDTVAKDQGVVEVETEKAVVEVPSDVAGRVREVHVKEGDEVGDGALLLTLDPGPGLPEAPQEQAVARDRAAESRPAPAAPSAPEPTVLAAEPASPPSVAHESARSPVIAADGDRASVPAAPSVRRFAREIGIDIADVAGSGPGGRISEEDVKAYARLRNGAAGAVPAVAGINGGPAFAAVPLPDLSRWGEVEREAMSGIRRATALNLSRTWASVPQVTQFDEADVTALEAFREKYGPRAAERGGKLTVTAILVKVAAAALKTFPKFAAAVDLTREELVYRRYFHIGVAVDTDRGLLVPVIRDVDSKSITQVAIELRELSEKARDRKLTLEEMQGGSFTISNLGGIGGTGFTPIVNAPEVAILGVARARTLPRWDGERFVPRTILPLSLTYDHRVIDGADGARFLHWIVEAIEQPWLLTLEG